MLKNECLADTINAVIAAIIKDPPSINDILTNCTVPLNINIPEISDHTGPYPCFCISIPKPIPRIINVTIIGIDVLNAAAISFFVTFALFTV